MRTQGLAGAVERTSAFMASGLQLRDSAFGFLFSGDLGPGLHTENACMRDLIRE